MEIIFLDSVSEPIKSHVYCSISFFLAFPLTMMFAAVLSIATGVGGCWCPISAREVLMDVTLWHFTNNPPNYAYMNPIQ